MKIKRCIVYTAEDWMKRVGSSSSPELQGGSNFIFLAVIKHENIVTYYFLLTIFLIKLCTKELYITQEKL